MNKLEELQLAWTNCKRCALCSNSKQVFSDGDISCRILALGESPGAKEDQIGKPFVGPAGQYLTQEFAKNNISRAEVFFTNATRGWARDGVKTRQPNQKELDACRPLLLSEIEIIKPRFILVLGAVAAKTLLNHKGSLSSIRGQWITFNNIPALVTWHPAAILHTSSKDPERCAIYTEQFSQDIADLSNRYHSLVTTVIAERQIAVKQENIF